MSERSHEQHMPTGTLVEKTSRIIEGGLWVDEADLHDDRQTYLAERLTITPDVKQGIYPFKDIKLTRAEVAWLLIKHENGRGHVDWHDESQGKREGLDLRGADL